MDIERKGPSKLPMPLSPEVQKKEQYTNQEVIEAFSGALDSLRQVREIRLRGENLSPDPEANREWVVKSIEDALEKVDLEHGRDSYKRHFDDPNLPPGNQELVLEERVPVEYLIDHLNTRLTDPDISPEQRQRIERQRQVLIDNSVPFLGQPGRLVAQMGGDVLKDEHGNPLPLTAADRLNISGRANEEAYLISKDSRATGEPIEDISKSERTIRERRELVLPQISSLQRNEEDEDGERVGTTQAPTAASPAPVQPAPVPPTSAPNTNTTSITSNNSISQPGSTPPQQSAPTAGGSGGGGTAIGGAPTPHQGTTTGSGVRERIRRLPRAVADLSGRIVREEGQRVAEDLPLITDAGAEVIKRGGRAAGIATRATGRGIATGGRALGRGARAAGRATGRQAERAYRRVNPVEADGVTRFNRALDNGINNIGYGIENRFRRRNPNQQPTPTTPAQPTTPNRPRWFNRLRRQNSNTAPGQTGGAPPIPNQPIPANFPIGEVRIGVGSQQEGYRKLAEYQSNQQLDELLAQSLPKDLPENLLPRIGRLMLHSIDPRNWSNMLFVSNIKEFHRERYKEQRMHRLRQINFGVTNRLSQQAAARVLEDVRKEREGGRAVAARMRMEGGVLRGEVGPLEVHGELRDFIVNDCLIPAMEGLRRIIPGTGGEEEFDALETEVQQKLFNYVRTHGGNPEVRRFFGRRVLVFGERAEFYATDILATAETLLNQQRTHNIATNLLDQHLQQHAKVDLFRAGFGNKAELGILGRSILERNTIFGMSINPLTVGIVSSACLFLAAGGVRVGRGMANVALPFVGGAMVSAIYSGFRRYWDLGSYRTDVLQSLERGQEGAADSNHRKAIEDLMKPIMVTADQLMNGGGVDLLGQNRQNPLQREGITTLAQRQDWAALARRYGEIRARLDFHRGAIQHNTDRGIDIGRVELVSAMAQIKQTLLNNGVTQQQLDNRVDECNRELLRITNRQEWAFWRYRTGQALESAGGAAIIACGVGFLSHEVLTTIANYAPQWTQGNILRHFARAGRTVTGQIVEGTVNLGERFINTLGQPSSIPLDVDNFRDVFTHGGELIIGDTRFVVDSNAHKINLVDNISNQPLPSGDISIRSDGHIEVKGEITSNIRRNLEQLGFNITQGPTEKLNVPVELIKASETEVTQINGLRTSIPNGTEWVRDGESWDLKIKGSGKVLIDNAQFNPDGSLKAGSVDSHLEVKNSFVETGVREVKTVKVLGGDGVWQEYKADVKKLNWYSYDQPGPQGNESKLHTFKLGNNGVTLTMDQMGESVQSGLDPSRVSVKSLIANKQSGFSFYIPGQGRIFVPDGADGTWDGKLGLNPDDRDPTHVIRMANGKTMQLGEFSRIVINSDAVSKLPAGDIATEVYGRQNVFRLSGGVIEASQLDNGNLRVFATIRGTAGVPDSIGISGIAQTAPNIEIKLKSPLIEMVEREVSTYDITPPPASQIPNPLGGGVNGFGLPGFPRLEDGSPWLAGAGIIRRPLEPVATVVPGPQNGGQGGGQPPAGGGQPPAPQNNPPAQQNTGQTGTGTQQNPPVQQPAQTGLQGGARQAAAQGQTTRQNPVTTTQGPVVITGGTVVGTATGAGAGAAAAAATVAGGGNPTVAGQTQQGAATGQTPPQQTGTTQGGATATGTQGGPTTTQTGIPPGVTSPQQQAAAQNSTDPQQTAENIETQLEQLRAERGNLENQLLLTTISEGERDRLNSELEQVEQEMEELEQRLSELNSPQSQNSQTGGSANGSNLEDGQSSMRDILERAREIQQRRESLAREIEEEEERISRGNGDSQRLQGLRTQRDALSAERANLRGLKSREGLALSEIESTADFLERTSSNIEDEGLTEEEAINLIVEIAQRIKAEEGEINRRYSSSTQLPPIDTVNPEVENIRSLDPTRLDQRRLDNFSFVICVQIVLREFGVFESQRYDNFLNESDFTSTRPSEIDPLFTNHFPNISIRRTNSLVELLEAIQNGSTVITRVRDQNHGHFVTILPGNRVSNENGNIQIQIVDPIEGVRMVSVDDLLQTDLLVSSNPAEGYGLILERTP